MSESVASYLQCGSLDNLARATHLAKQFDGARIRLQKSDVAVADYGDFEVGILRRQAGTVCSWNPWRTDYQVGKRHVMRQCSRFHFSVHQGLQVGEGTDRPDFHDVTGRA